MAESLETWDDPPKKYWERQIHACLGILAVSGYVSTDELRRAVEGLHDEQKMSVCYYGKWALAIAQILLEKGQLSLDALDKELGGAEKDCDPEPTLATGDHVRVHEESLRTRWRKPHVRTPGYIFGQYGVVERLVGSFSNPELAAYGRKGAKQPMYRVRFIQKEIWIGYDGPASDTVEVEVYQPWLTKVSAEAAMKGRGVASSAITSSGDAKRRRVDGGVGHTHEDAHTHDHEHGHSHEHEGAACGGHETRADVERRAIEREGEEEDVGQRYAEALLRAIIAKGLVTAEKVRISVEALDTMGQQHEGARIVARAWMDDAFKERLLKDGNSAAAELGIDAVNPNAPTVLTAVANSPKLHHLVVCTLCSCYPSKLLGLSPAWYKTRSYRERAVREPRSVLKEFGTDVGENVEVRVVDSTADCRYLVIPMRPQGSEHLSEEGLIKLVTRDSMIGVCVLPPYTDK